MDEHPDTNQLDVQILTSQGIKNKTKNKTKSKNKSKKIIEDRRPYSKIRKTRLNALQSKPIIFTDDCMLGEEFIDKYELINTFVSKTVSKSIMSFYYEKAYPHTSLIIKKIPFSNAFHRIQFNFEKEHYQMMNTLITENITPHLFMGLQNFECSPVSSASNSTSTSTSTSTKYGILFLETCNKEYFDIMNLEDFIKKYLTNDKFHFAYMNILFQIIYTLSCFTKIKFKHNDLHLGNIIICIRKINIFSKEWYPKFVNKYKYDDNTIANSTLREAVSHFDLMDIGIYAHIIDFGTSVKNRVNTRYPELNNEMLFIDAPVPRVSKNIIINDINNPYFDIFKIMGILFYLADKHKFTNSQYYKCVCESFYTFLNLPYKADLSSLILSEEDKIKLKLTPRDANLFNPQKNFAKLIELQAFNIIEYGQYFNLTNTNRDRITTAIHEHDIAEMNRLIAEDYVNVVKSYFEMRKIYWKKARFGIDEFVEFGVKLPSSDTYIGKYNTEILVDTKSFDIHYYYLSKEGNTLIPTRAEMLSPDEFVPKLAQMITELQNDFITNRILYKMSKTKEKPSVHEFISNLRLDNEYDSTKLNEII